MNSRLTMIGLFGSTLLLGAVAATVSQGGPPTVVTTADETGDIATLTLAPSFNVPSPFLQPLGTNQRTCESCHQVGQGMGVTATAVEQRFTNTQGMDPIFRIVDGSDSPVDAVTTLAQRRAAYSMLISKGVIRVSLPVPSTAEFTLAAVQDPYGYSNAQHMSLFRRPLPSANLRFESTVMWDGRESQGGPANPQDFIQQAGDAVVDHEQGQMQSTTQLSAIFNFEAPIYAAQVSDAVAGPLNAPGVSGGPAPLIQQPWFPGINDPLGRNPQRQPFNPIVFTLYNGWSTLRPDGTPATAERLSIARGEAIFNTLRFNISGVAGLNDIAGRPTISASCSFCHNSPNVGTRSLPDLMHTGIADAQFRTPDMPLYTLKNKTTSATIQTTDPGSALVTGKWADIGKFKVPNLRGLAARAPYMHNGSQATLEDVVEFYNNRFSIGLDAGQKADLAAFLSAL